MPMKVRVLIVDDHPLLRDGLRQALERESNVAVAGDASTGREALQRVKETTPDLVLLDMHLPDLDGVEVSRQILAERPTVKILAFSSDSNRALVDAALQAGVCGYLLKDTVAEEFLRAIRMVMDGRLYLSPELASSVIRDHIKALSASPAPAKPMLSEREQHLLRCISEGLPNKEIAARLEVGVKSVEKYRSHLMRKLGCQSAAELIRYAIREGIAPC